MYSIGTVYAHYANVKVFFDSCALYIEVVVSPDADADAIVTRLGSEHDSACSSLVGSLAKAGENNGMVNRQNFYSWAETMAPQISATLSTFMHNLLFHGKMLKHRLNFVLFEPPKLDQRSDIFEGVHPPNMFALTCTSPLIGGKVWYTAVASTIYWHILLPNTICTRAPFLEISVAQLVLI